MPPVPAGDIAVGAYVEVTAGRGYVRFAGATQFAPGKWVGVELDKANGKNDGSVAGVHYFDAAPLHGVFVRPSQAKVVARPAANNVVSALLCRCQSRIFETSVTYRGRLNLRLPRVHRQSQA